MSASQIQARSLIRQIELVAIVFGGLSVLVSFTTGDLKVIAGVALGAMIAWANLAIVRLLFDMGARSPDQRGLVMGAVLIKFVFLMTAVTIIILVVGVNGVGFLVGFSAMVAATMAVPFFNLVRHGHVLGVSTQDMVDEGGDNMVEENAPSDDPEV